MRKPRTKIYTKVTPEEKRIVYSGIDFFEFSMYLPNPIENLLLLKGDYLGNKCIHNFELLEGTEEIAKLEKEDIYSYGDFVFLDYNATNSVAALSKQQIAEMLYLAHMSTTMQSPFFELLQNRFFYIAHDDGSYCKLYCQNLSDYFTVLNSKISRIIRIPEPNYLGIINNQWQKISESGILIDLDEIKHKNGGIDVKIYSIGEYSNMDLIFNNIHKIKDIAGEVSNLYCCEENWVIT